MVNLRPHKRRLWQLALLFGGVMVAAVFVMLETPRARLLHQPPPPRQPRLQFLGPVRPLVRNAWLKIMPRRSSPLSIVLQADVFVCTNRFRFTRLPPASLVLSNRGTWVWLVKTNKLAMLGQEVEQATEFTAFAQTSSYGAGLARAAFHGAPVDGQWLQSSMRARGADVDMSLFITSVGIKLSNDTDRPSATNPFLTWTNFAFGVQLIVPAGHAVIILHEGATNTHTSGAFINVDGYRPGQLIQPRQLLSPKSFQSGKKFDYIL